MALAPLDTTCMHRGPVTPLTLLKTVECTVEGSMACHVQVTKHIRVRSGSAGGESAQDLASFTPAFLWLLRDFYLGALLCSALFCSALL